ncbi:MAG: hypothetical protein H7222_02135 [Methylotenera sp.]|nr:hypothetical protein [Oligoflexia bacterium]
MKSRFQKGWLWSQAFEQQIREVGVIKNPDRFAPSHAPEDMLYLLRAFGASSFSRSRGTHTWLMISGIHLQFVNDFALESTRSVVKNYARACVLFCEFGCLLYGYDSALHLNLNLEFSNFR